MSIFKQIFEPRPAGPSDRDVPERTLRTGLRGRRIRSLGGATTALRRSPELGGLIGLAGILNFWALGKNGWANTYYAAAVRSMSTSWHNFLFASLDPSGVMTIDKPPLALWIQALSVRVFGYHPLSILVPDALIGIATVVLLYDLVRRLFGRVAGFVAGFALATTPITVAMSRHNNPDALLALCCVAALWFLVRALGDGRTRWSASDSKRRWALLWSWYPGSSRLGCGLRRGGGASPCASCSRVARRCSPSAAPGRC